MAFVFALFIFGAFGIALIVIDGMWRAWLMYKATINAQAIIRNQSNKTPSPAELNTMDCKGGQ